MTLKGLLRVVLFVIVLFGHGTLSQLAWRVYLDELPPQPLIGHESWDTLSFPVFHVVPRRIQHLYFRELMFLNSACWGLAAVLLSLLIRKPPRGKRLADVAAAQVTRPPVPVRPSVPGPASPAPSPLPPLPPSRAAPPAAAPEVIPHPAERPPVAPAGARTFGKGRYEVLGTLGSGGFGSVYRVRDRTRGIDVALKTIDLSGIPPEDMADYRTLFQQEAATAGRLDHHGIVPVFDHDASAEKPYIVMSLISGGTLRDRMDQSTNRRLAWPVVRDIGVQVAEALEYARQHGVRAHRDIKPANIFCTASGYKVADFGIARAVRVAARDTASSFIAGTPSYMAPEQALYPDSVDWRADMFSLCVVLYEALTGVRPYRTVRIEMEEGDDPAPMQRMLEAAYSTLTPVRDLAPETHPAVARAIERGLQFDRVKRFSSWGEFIAALRSAGTRVTVVQKA